MDYKILATISIPPTIKIIKNMSQLKTPIEFQQNLLSEIPSQIEKQISLFNKLSSNQNAFLIKNMIQIVEMIEINSWFDKHCKLLTDYKKVEPYSYKLKTHSSDINFASKKEAKSHAYFLELQNNI